ncbi:MAG: ExbD/TolR family protein [Verrucomicrobiales bacterium]
MSFYVKKRRMPVIQVVPLIDILTVLVIFFVVTTTFKKQSKNTLLKISLPQVSQLKPLVETTPRTPLAVTAGGELFLADQPVLIEDLSAAIRDLLAREPATRLELKADENASLGILVKVWDALADAGLKINTDVPTKILVNKKAE